MAKNKGKFKDIFYRLKTEQSTSTFMSTKEIWSYGLCDFGKSGSQQLISSTTYINMFLVMGLGIDVLSFGILMTVSQIIGYVQGPFISLLEDSTKTKWGRFRPYFIITAPLTAVFAILFFLNPFNASTKTGADIWMYIIYILFGISNGFCTTAWNGLTKCITQNPKERERAFSISKGLGIVSTTVPSWIPVMVEFGPKIGISVRLVFVILSCFLGLLGLVAVVTAKNMQERVMIEHVEKPWKTIGMVFKNKNKMITWISTIGSIFNYTVNIATPYVIMYCYEAYSMQTFIWGIAGIFAWITLFGSKFVYKHMSSKAIVITYNTMTIIANLVLFAVGYGTGIGYIIALFATRAFAAMFEYIGGVATNTFDTDIWDHYEWKYHIRNESTTDLVGSWVAAPINILNPLIYAWVFKKIGFIEGDNVVQTEETKKWLFAIYTIGASIGCFFTILPYLLIKLDKKTMDIVHKELEERRLAREGATPAMALAMQAGGTVTGDFIPAEEVDATAMEEETAAEEIIEGDAPEDAAWNEPFDSDGTPEA